MQTKELIDKLELLAKKHKNDRYFTFETRWIDVLKTVIEKLKELDWHTGTPTEGGLFLVYLKDGTYDIYEFGKEYKAWHIGFKGVVAWQRIEPYKEDET